MPWPVTDPSHNLIVSEIEEQSDRAAAILAVSFLEDRFTSLLKLWFADEPSVIRNMLGGHGPLGTFAAKIDMGLLLGIIEKKRHTELHLIRKIRNEFAHGIENLTFDTNVIRAKCAAFSVPHQDDVASSDELEVLKNTNIDKWLIEIVWAASKGPDTSRGRFLNAVRLNHFNFALLGELKKRGKLGGK